MRISKLAGTVTATLVLTFSAAASAQITSGELDPRDSWNLAGPDFTASGVFITGNMPAANFEGPVSSGQPVNMGWTSGSVDGWGGTMILDGMHFILNGSDEVGQESIMTVSANAFTVDHSGTYQEPFAFSGDFCGWIKAPNAGPCDATLGLSGNGTVSMVVAQIPGDPAGTFGFESISYTFGNATNVPEPASLGLLVMGVALIGRRRRLRYRTN